MKSPFKDKPNIRRYSILPARLMQDESVTRAEIRVMACIGMYSNSHGICWPSQTTIGRHLGHNRVWISKQVSSLIRKGYLRKLKHKDYPKHVQRRSAGRTNRYQILWEGNDPLPSLEEFWTPAPKFAVDDQDDVMPFNTDMKSGVKGDSGKDYQVLAQAFRSAVERTSGVHRLAEPSYQAAKTLYDQGVSINQVRDHTAAATKDALRNNRQPPLTLDQVAKWAGLYKK